jgi:hypothetical protein
MQAQAMAVRHLAGLPQIWLSLHSRERDVSSPPAAVAMTVLFVQNIPTA